MGHLGIAVLVGIVLYSTSVKGVNVIALSGRNSENDEYHCKGFSTQSGI